MLLGATGKSAVELGGLSVGSRHDFFPTAFFPFLAAPLFLPLSKRSNTAATMSGRPTVASRNTSPNFPPSAGGTNLPHEIASLSGLPDRPPQYTGSGQMRKP